MSWHVVSLSRAILLGLLALVMACTGELGSHDPSASDGGVAPDATAALDAGPPPDGSLDAGSENPDARAADGGPAGPTCGDVLASSGFAAAGACEADGNGACNGNGSTTADCGHCCVELSCGDFAAQRETAVADPTVRVTAECLSDATGCGTGRGFATTDCGFCCLREEMVDPRPEGHLLPFSCGSEVRVSQGNWSSFSHTGKAGWAFDFAVGLNTPIHATESGTVILAYNGTRPGHACYDGGGNECANDANYVVIEHDDGTATLYLHLNEAEVGVGEVVHRGDRIGLSGTTGWSTAAHLHYQRQQVCGSWWCQSVEVMFADVMGDTPMYDDWVISGNGC